VYLGVGVGRSLPLQGFYQSNLWVQKNQSAQSGLNSSISENII